MSHVVAVIIKWMLYISDIIILASKMSGNISQMTTSNYQARSEAPLITTDTYPTATEKVLFATSGVAGTLYALIGSLGIIGNFVVVVVFLANSKLRKNIINMYIINQSCIDFIVSINVIGLKGLSSDALDDGLAGLAYCLFWQSRVFLWGLMTSSTYNLLCLTLERYSAIVHPIWNKRYVSRRKALCTMIFVWIFGFSLEALVKFSTAHLENGQCRVYFTWPSPVAKAMFGFVWIFVKLLVPSVTLIYSYGRIAYVLHKKVNKKGAVNVVGKSAKDETFAHGKRNTIKTLFVVATCFLLCWSWNQVAFFRFNLGYPVNFTTNEYHTTVMLVYLNTCINPFIYAFKYREFQQAAIKLFCPSLKCGQCRVEDGTITSLPNTENTP